MRENNIKEVTVEQMKEWHELEQMYDNTRALEKLTKEEQEKNFYNVWTNYTNKQALELYKKMNKYVYVTSSIRMKRYLYTLGFNYVSLFVDGIEHFIFIKSDDNFNEVVDFFVKVRKANKEKSNTGKSNTNEF